MRLSTKTLGSASAKSFFVAFVIAIGVISFIVTGIGFQMGRLDSNSAARVGSQIVTVRQFSEAVQQLNTQSGGQLDEERRRANMDSALNQLVQEKVLIEEAQRIGWQPSDTEIADWIRRIPAFQDPQTKQFDRKLYQKFLQSGQLSELELYSRGRDSISQERLWALFQIPAYMPTALAEEASKRNKLEFEVEFVELKPSEESIKKEIETEATKFAADPANATKLQEAYNAAKDEFKQKASVNAQTILIAFKGAERAEGDALNRTEAQAKELAEKILGRAKGGENFATLASETNDDSRAKAAKGDIGWIDESGLDPDSTKALFALNKEKTLSDVVKTPFGFRILKWLDSKPAIEKKFEDVKHELAVRQVSPQIRNKATSELEDAVRAAATDKAKLDAAFQKNNLAWKKLSKPINANSRFVEEIGLADGVIAKVFALKNPGDITPSPVDAGGRRFLFKLISKKEGTAETAKVEDIRRMHNMRSTQSFVAEAQKKLMEVYSRNKEIKRNDALFAAR